MSAELETLYFSGKGYLLRNDQDGFYQLGFFSFILAMKADEFQYLCKVVGEKIAGNDQVNDPDGNARTCVIPTPFNGMQLTLTKRELESLHEILVKGCEAKLP